MLPQGDSTERDFRDLNAWGCKLARYQMQASWKAQDGLSAQEVYFRQLDGRLNHLEQVLQWAEKFGLKIVVDLHGSPGGRTNGNDIAMCHDRRYADVFVETWRRIATRFRGRREIYGFDLVNEPQQWRRALPECDYWTLQLRAAKAIRAIDSETPIIVESNGGDAPYNFKSLRPFDLENVIYQAHMYEPFAFTHQGVFSPIGKTYPCASNGWDRAMLSNVLKPVRDFQIKHGARILIGEFSAAAWAQGADAYLRDCMSIFAEYDWDWCYHAFREWPGWSVEHEGESSGAMKHSADNPRKRALLSGLAGK